jgi:hypothetical protein
MRAVLNNGKGKEVNAYYKEAGYVTGWTRNICDGQHFIYNSTEVEDYSQQFEPFDHENLAMFCDPIYFDRWNPWSIYKGPYSIYRRWLYGKETSEYVIEYAEKFWEAYTDVPKYFEMGFEDGHEMTGEICKYLDDKLVNFLEKMDEKGSLNDTVIIIYADHGLHRNFMASVDFNSSETVEHRFPALFTIFPRDLADKYGETLRNNEQKLIGSYDLGVMLKQLSGNWDYPDRFFGEAFKPTGENFMMKTLQDNRTCEDIKSDGCFCH